MSEPTEQPSPQDAESRALPHAAQLHSGFSRLRFDQPIEGDFRDDIWNEHRQRTVITILIGAAILTVFGIKDMLVLPPEVWRWTSGIRFFLVTPALLFAAYATREFSRRNSEIAVMVGSALALYGLDAAIFISHRLDHPLPYEGLLLIVFYVYFVVNFRWRSAMSVCLPIIPIHALGMIYIGQATDIVVIQTLYITMFNLVGCVGLYGAELIARRGWLNAHISEFRANHDPLTTLYNRRALFLDWERVWRNAERRGELVAVFLIDIDHFKRYNDHYGHRAGDECLREVARALRETFSRPLDLIARYGGEEFVVVALPVSLRGVETLSARVLNTVRQLDINHRGVGDDARLTVSVGVACSIPDLKYDCDRMIELADQALYQAKQQGRDRVVVAHDSQQHDLRAV